MNGFAHANDRAPYVHSPKVFAVETVTANASAKDVFGTNHGQYHTKPPQKMHNFCDASSYSVGHLTNGNGIHTAPITRLQPLSSSYDRYPKPGSYGSLQVYPMNGINSEINNAKEHERHTNAQQLGQNGDELTQTEQERLDEILRMCADFERQNQSVQSSPIVQNRIKTNGSLPRDKKSPLNPNEHLVGSPNVFFPSSPSIDARKPMAGQSPAHSAANGYHGYENIHSSAGVRQNDQSRSDDSGRHSITNGGQTMNGYENCSPVKRSPVGYVPQSPRTRIKTCISPKRDVTSTPLHHQRKAEYELLVQSFEDKLRMEVQQLQDIRSGECEQNNRGHRVHTPSRPVEQPQTLNNTANGDVCGKFNANQSSQSNHSIHSIGGSESIYGSLTAKSRPTKACADDRSLLQRNLDEKQVAQLKKQHVEVLRKTRELKSQISELQRQEEEVLREVRVLCQYVLNAFI